MLYNARIVVLVFIFLFTACGNEIKPELVQELDGESLLGSIAFSPDGKLLISNNSKRVMVWDLATGQQMRTIDKENTDPTWWNGIQFSPSGSLIAVADGKAIELWDTDTYEVNTVLGGNYDIRSATFSVDGELVATGDIEGLVRLWSVSTGEEVSQFKVSDTAITAVVFSPNGKRLVAGDIDGGAGILDLESGEVVATAKANGMRVDSMAFSPDGTFLATTDRDGQGQARVWNLSSGEKATLSAYGGGPMGNVVFSPDGRFVATGGVYQAKLWNPSDGTLKMSIGENTMDQRLIYAVTISPDGKLIAFGGFSQQREKIEIWSIPAP